VLATPNSIGLPLSQIWKGGRGLLHPATSQCPDIGERVFSFWKWKPVSWKRISVSYLGNGNNFLGTSGAIVVDVDPPSPPSPS